MTFPGLVWTLYKYGSTNMTIFHHNTPFIWSRHTPLMSQAHWRKCSSFQHSQDEEIHPATCPQYSDIIVAAVEWQEALVAKTI